jgi:hypothetical protein
VRPELDAVLRGLDAVTVEAALPGFVELFKFNVHGADAGVS